ncbi:MAG: nuclear transport factor 2 family protein [Gemmatimonadetes bacterium]|nr:nuclear transport factor 2 family protein [Gemmatimonadota bacterium]
MTKRILSAMICSMLVAAAAPSVALAQNDDESAVVKVLLAIAQYSQEGDLGAMDTLYASGGGVHIIEGAGVNHGWEDYRDNHLAPELEGFENFQYRYFSIEPEVRGDVAWTAFRYDLSVDTSRGHTEIEGRGTAVLEKMNGRWQIVHMHTSGRPKRDGG